MLQVASAAVDIYQGCDKNGGQAVPTPYMSPVPEKCRNHGPQTLQLLLRALSDLSAQRVAGSGTTSFFLRAANS